MSLELNKKPNEKWTTTLHAGLRMIAVATQVTLDRSVRGLVEEGDIYNSAYILMCEHPNTSWVDCARTIRRMFNPMGARAGRPYTAKRPAKYGCLNNPYPEGVNPNDIARAWGLDKPVPECYVFCDETDETLRVEKP